MNRIAGLALVLLISGVPTTALLCGASCVEPTRPTASGCHEHGSGTQANRIGHIPHHDCHHAPAFVSFVTERKQSGSAFASMTLAIIDAAPAAARAPDSLVQTSMLRGSPPRSAPLSPGLRI